MSIISLLTKLSTYICLIISYMYTIYREAVTRVIREELEQVEKDSVLFKCDSRCTHSIAIIPSLSPLYNENFRLIHIYSYYLHLILLSQLILYPYTIKLISYPYLFSQISTDYGSRLDCI